ncbi:MAG TPA: HEAT repeat domain-containing protein [Polyangia bacterium]|nr:HEAT repeat domain-containing protein [Polyangia bacterium]
MSRAGIDGPMVRQTARTIRLALFPAVLVLLAAVFGAFGPAMPRAWAAAPPGKVDELCRALLDDSNYKVRVQAALVLGRLRDPSAEPSLTKALADQNKTVRAIAAQALGQIADPSANESLKGLLQRESDSFVRLQVEKALALLSSGGTVKKNAKIYLNFGSFTGGVKSAGADDAKTIHDALARELGKLQLVTLALANPDPKLFPKSGLLGFFIDGNITRLDDSPAGSASETSCDVKVLVARWPTKAIILWTNAGASLQSGSRPRDKENARRDCLEASAGQLSEDLTKFFKSQGG